MIEMSVSSLVDSTVAQLPEIQHGVFENRVAIDVNFGSIGTAYPIGTLQYPVNNLNDAKLICASRGFNTLRVRGHLTINSIDNVSGFTIIGDGVENSRLILTQGCITSKTEFQQMSISGFQDGETHYNHCEIKELGGVHCKFEDCLLVGPLTMEEGTYADTTVLVNCYTGWDRTISSPLLKDECIINLNNSSVNMAFIGFYGKLKFINLNRTTTAGTVAVNMGGGKVTIDASCSTGAIKVRGDGEVVDNSTGTIVDNDVTSNLIGGGLGSLTTDQNNKLMSLTNIDLPTLVDAVWNKPISNGSTVTLAEYVVNKLLTTNKFIALS
jgi:hypothetical protein